MLRFRYLAENLKKQKEASEKSEKTEEKSDTKSEELDLVPN